MSNDADDMCEIDDNDELLKSDVRDRLTMSENIKSFNPMSDLEHREVGFDSDQSYMPPGQSGIFNEGQRDFSFPCVPSLSEEDDELTESKIKSFLDEKALELKKLQTPLYKEFYNSVNTSCSPNVMESARDETTTRYLKSPPKSRSPSRTPVSAASKAIDNNTGSPGSNSKSSSDIGNSNNGLPEIPVSPLNELKRVLVDSNQEPSSPSLSSERQRKWKEELDQELERKREMIRQAGKGGKTSSPKDRALLRQRERTRFASPSQ